MTRGWAQMRLGDFTLENQWDVEPGSVLALFGPSGSGKTLTLRAIAGLVTPAKGQIEVGGQVVFDSAKGISIAPHRRRVGYVPQDYQLFPHLDVAGNIAFGLRGRDPAARRERVAELMSIFRISELEHRRMWELSGGQRQRVGLARALASDPAVLLLDEPFSALDVEVRRQVRGEVRDILKRANIPVILVTHDREDVLALGDSIQILDRGQALSRGEPLALLGHPRQGRVSQLVGVENIIPMTVEKVDEHEGVMLCEADGFRLEAPLVDTELGERVKIGIRAWDIILASERPVGLSARNLIPGRVESVEPSGATYRVTLDCGVPLRCQVTYRAIQELGIAPGATLWAVVKASSCFVIDDGSE